MDRPAGFAVFATQLDRWDVDELVEAAAQVDELRSHAGWGVIERLVRERREFGVTNLVLQSQSLSEGEIRRQLGLLNGMESGLHAADAVVFAAAERERQEQEAAERRAEQEE